MLQTPRTDDFWQQVRGPRDSCYAGSHMLLEAAREM